MVTNDVLQECLRLAVLLVSFIIVIFSVVLCNAKYYGPLVSINRFVEGVSKGIIPKES